MVTSLRQSEAKRNIGLAEYSHTSLSLPGTMLQYAQYEMQRFNEKCINSLQNAKQAYRRQTGSYYVSNGEAPPTLKIKPGNGFQSVCFYLTKGS